MTKPLNYTPTKNPAQEPQKNGCSLLGELPHPQLAPLLNQIHEGNCLELMQAIPDESIDMILCDPPYGTTQNKWDSIIPLDEMWHHYNRITKPNAAIVLFAQGLFTAQLIMSNPKHYKYKLVWEKARATNFLNAKKQPLRKHEDIIIFYKKQPTYNPQMTQGTPYKVKEGLRRQQTGSYGKITNNSLGSPDGSRYPLDIVRYTSDPNTIHPTQKPLALGRYLVKTYTNPGDVVLDNACGVGTFPLAAAIEDRHYIGMELNEAPMKLKTERIDYVQEARDRIKEALSLQSREPV